jgi:hypothetical protein
LSRARNSRSSTTICGTPSNTGPDVLSATPALGARPAKDLEGAGQKYLFSGLLRCGVCGGAYVIQDRTHYGCADHKNRAEAVCTNRLKVRRSTIETVLLEGIKAGLLSEEAYRVFEAEARALLKQAKPDPSAARRRLADAKKEVDNLMAAIRAGIITPTTKAALEEAERALVDARAHLATIEQFEPTQILPRAREIYRDLVARLESIEDVDGAREAIKGSWEKRSASYPKTVR